VGDLFGGAHRELSGRRQLVVVERRLAQIFAAGRCGRILTGRHVFDERVLIGGSGPVCLPDVSARREAPQVGDRLTPGAILPWNRRRFPRVTCASWSGEAPLGCRRRWNASKIARFADTAGPRARPQETAE